MHILGESDAIWERNHPLQQRRLEQQIRTAQPVCVPPVTIPVPRELFALLL